MTFQLNDSVRVVQPTIEGKVVGAIMGDNFKVKLLVEYAGADGEIHQRYFEQEQLEAIPVKG